MLREGMSFRQLARTMRHKHRAKRFTFSAVRIDTFFEAPMIRRLKLRQVRARAALSK